MFAFLWGQALPPFPAFGAAAEEPFELEEEIVSAAVFEEDSDRSPGAVTVVRAEELSGEMQSLPDLL